MRVRIDPENQDLEKRTLTIDFIAETEEDMELLTYYRYQEVQRQLELEFTGKPNTINTREEFVKRVLELYGFSADDYNEEEFEVKVIPSTKDNEQVVR